VDQILTVGDLDDPIEEAESLEMRIASVIAYILPTDYAEEWRGDLREATQKLTEEGKPRWACALITVGRILLLIWSLVRIKIDLVLARRQGEPK
jgi:hypothetical protein